jgi:EAL domain-containing protein (putative c-di-GMP-specific phosphodiesterase class I)
LKYADFAMYEAKHKEKGTLFEFDPNDFQETYYLFENREAINLLLDEELIHFACQPIVNLKTGETFAYELLMRSLMDNFKNPMEILAVAAAQSKLYQLERLVFFKAFQMIDEYAKELGSRKIFINSIPSQILNQDDLHFLEEQYHHVFQMIVVEITEEEQSSETMWQKANCLREKESKLAIDDFGSGYSNEVRILSVSPDIVKIDMNLIQGIHQDQDKQNRVFALVEFFHDKQVEVVAEGVETFHDLITLIQMDIDYAQGYYIGRPLYKVNGFYHDV